MRSFQRVDVKDFPALAKAFEKDGTRRISEVHLHHTWKPNYANYQRIKDQSGAETAGRKLVESMWRNHVEERKFSDIAQHVTIDPDGYIWLCRPWNMAPASAVGFNGSSRLGPFMIEMIGDFDVGRDDWSKPQHNAAIAVIASVQRAFGLGAGALRFHNEMSSKTCPGDSMNKNALITEIAAWKETTGRGARKAAQAAPLPDDQIVATPTMEAPDFSLLRTILTPAARSYQDDGEICDRDYDAYDSGRGVSAAGAAGKEQLTPDMLRDLRPHVVNLANGRFSRSGAFESDLTLTSEIFTVHYRKWAAAQQRNNRPARMVVYAHGGLVDEKSALIQAFRQHSWWLANGVYPVFFIWETGPIEIALQALRQRFGQDGRDLPDIADWAWEKAARGIGKALWDGMKSSALNASAPQGGAIAVADLIASEGKNNPIELHLVGHSAGAIFLSHLIPELASRALKVKTLHLLAPAVRTDLFKQNVIPAAKTIDRTRLFAMTREVERVDPTMRHFFYRKSILYAVRNAFEDNVNDPVLGLEECLRADPALVAHFGLGAAPPTSASVYWSPDADAPPRERTTSRSHGFDWNSDTMTAVLLEVLGRDDPSGLAPFPEKPPGVRGDADLAVGSVNFWDDADDALRGFTATPSAPAPSPDMPAPAAISNGRNGRVHALSIGIDRYEIAPALTGCVNDTDKWSALFRRAGATDVRVLRDHQADRTTILDAFTSLVTGARAGDLVLIHYSGHGTQFDSQDDDEPQDQAIVPHDGKGQDFILDDELRQIFARLQPGVKAEIFMDCCHSATNLRALGEPRARSIDPSPAMLALYRQRKPARLGLRSREIVAALPYVQWAACSKVQSAYEADQHGRFTLSATRVLAKGDLTRQAALREILKEFRDRAWLGMQQPNIDSAPEALLQTAF